MPNDHAQAEEPSGVGDRMPVIAGGGGDQSNLSGVIDLPATAFGSDIAHKVDAAAYFEGANRLQVLQLCVVIAAQLFGKFGDASQRRL